MKPIDNEIDKTLRTASRIETIPPSDALMQRLRQIPSDLREGYESIPKKYLWIAAASIALLIAVNIVSARNYSSAQKASTSDTNTESYFSHLYSL